VVVLIGDTLQYKIGKLSYSNGKKIKLNLAPNKYNAHCGLREISCESQQLDSFFFLKCTKTQKIVKF